MLQSRNIQRDGIQHYTLTEFHLIKTTTKYCHLKKWLFIGYLSRQSSNLWQKNTEAQIPERNWEMWGREKQKNFIQKVSN